MIGRMVPDVILKVRERDGTISSDNPYRWADLSTGDLFANGCNVVFGLPGAFTPTCTSEQCPAFESQYAALRAAGADEVYCIAVNDAFVMHRWGQMLKLDKVKLLPDGSGDFTRRLGMLIDKSHLGFGYRSWRYAMVIQDGKIVAWFEEPGINDAGSDDDPYGVSSPDNVLNWLQSRHAS